MVTYDDAISVLIRLALEEDGPDITADALDFDGDERIIRTAMVSKDSGVFCGQIILDFINRNVDGIDIQCFLADGDKLARSQKIADISGSARTLLQYERILLNLIQRLSGVATSTNSFVAKAEKHNVAVYDTRKNPPGYRVLDKYAVRCGGGLNHRLGLSEGYFFKENHFIYSLGFKEQVRRLKNKGISEKESCVVETRSADEALFALNAGFSWVLLDNFSVNDLGNFVPLARSLNPDRKLTLEYSGNVALDNIEDICATGVDAVSIGSLTHSVRGFDISIVGD